MNLNLFNNLLNHAKENNFVQNFIKELSESLGKEDKLHSTNLKQEDSIYQVVEMCEDGAFLQNVGNNKTSKETDIPKEILDNIGNDTVLRYKNGEYIIEEELTQKFFDSLVDIGEYKDIQDKFLEESNILEMDSSTIYKLDERKENYSILSYGDNEKSTIEVPNALIPFWANCNDNLYFKNGKFNRDI